MPTLESRLVLHRFICAQFGYADLRGGLNRVYVNEDQNLSALKGNRDQWNVKITELVFRRLMFKKVGCAD